MTGPAGTPSGQAAGSVAGTPGTGAAPKAAPEPDADKAAPEPDADKAAPEPDAAKAAKPAAEPAAADDTPAPAAGTATARKGRRRGGPSWGLLAASLLIALLALAAVAVLLFARPSDGDLRDSALQAARTYTSSLTTYDHSTLASDIERVQRVATGQFREEYDETVEQLRPQIEQQRTVAVGTVVAAGVEELSDERASVVVAVDQNITTQGQPARTEANRLRMVLVRREGTWLVERVERL